jgi:hypothetical protein
VTRTDTEAEPSAVNASFPTFATNVTSDLAAASADGPDLLAAHSGSAVVVRREEPCGGSKAGLLRLNLVELVLLAARRRALLVLA